MDLGYIKELVSYHFWANDRIMRAVDEVSPADYTRDLGSSFPSIQATLAHLMFAEAVWLSRWTGEQIAPPKPEDLPTQAAARERWRSLEERFRSYVDGLSQADLDRVVIMRNSAGKELRHPLWEMLAHVVNHGTYHRGQVTTMLRQVGAEAPATDLIHYYRARSGQL